MVDDALIVDTLRKSLAVPYDINITSLVALVLENDVVNPTVSNLVLDTSPEVSFFPLVCYFGGESSPSIQNFSILDLPWTIVHKKKKNSSKKVTVSFNSPSKALSGSSVAP